MTGRWFSPGIPVSSTNKTDRHDITEKLLKVVLNTITPNPEIELMIYLTDISFSEKLLIYLIQCVILTVSKKNIIDF